MMHFIYQLNGLYDIACALAILKVIDIPILSKIHMNMFIDCEERFIAYWILTYGIIRFFSNERGIVLLTYLIESCCVATELIHGNVRDYKGIAVIFACIYLAIFI